MQVAAKLLQNLEKNSQQTPKIPDLKQQSQTLALKIKKRGCSHSCIEARALVSEKMAGEIHESGEDRLTAKARWSAATRWVGGQAGFLC